MRMAIADMDLTPFFIAVFVILAFFAYIWLREDK
jgi:hypothetical protein